LLPGARGYHPAQEGIIRLFFEVIIRLDRMIQKACPTVISSEAKHSSQ
jgi:hypothetical protein